MATSKPMDDITECPICAEVYVDPRGLPCLHTFCLKCIESMSKDKRPGDQLACPLCRKQFILPRNGVSDLPKNFFVANFLQARESTSVESKTNPCDACSGGEGKVQNAPSVYCVECEMKLCQICERGHKVIKATRSHKLVDIDSCRADRCREMLKSLEKKKVEFIEQVQKTGVEITEKVEQLKRMIDDHREKLMNELSSVKEKRMKEISSLREDIEKQLMSMERDEKYVGEVRQKGTACDTARAASGLHDGAEELMTFDVIERTMAELGLVDVTFTSSDFVIDDVSKTLGRLRLSSVNSGKTNQTDPFHLRYSGECEEIDVIIW